MINLKDYQLTIFMLPQELHMKHPAIARIGSFLEGALNIDFCHLNGEIAEEDVNDGEIAQVGDIVYFPDDGEIISLTALIRDIEESMEGQYPIQSMREEVDFVNAGSILHMPAMREFDDHGVKKMCMTHQRHLPLQPGCALIVLAPLKYADEKMGGARSQEVMNATRVQMSPPEETTLWLQSDPGKMYLYDESQQEVTQVDMSKITPMFQLPKFDTIEKLLEWKDTQRLDLTREAGSTSDPTSKSGFTQSNFFQQ